jgi:hypothetical protein
MASTAAAAVLCLIFAACHHPREPARRSEPVSPGIELEALAQRIRKAAAGEPIELGLDTRVRAVELLAPRHAVLARPLLVEAVELVLAHPQASTDRTRLLTQATQLGIRPFRDLAHRPAPSDQAAHLAQPLARRVVLGANPRIRGLLEGKAGLSQLALYAAKRRGAPLHRQ